MHPLSEPIALAAAIKDRDGANEFTLMLQTVLEKLTHRGAIEEIYGTTFSARMMVATVAPELSETVDALFNTARNRARAHELRGAH